jgi:hypothetical protein
VNQQSLRGAKHVLAGVGLIDRHPVITYVSAFLVCTLVMASPFLFGDRAFAYSDIGTDTFVQFYPLNVVHAQQLAAGGGLGWSFNLGLGGYVGTHFDPFWLAQGLLPESAQLQARIYVYLLKLWLAGLFFVGYLRLIGFRGLLAVLGGLAYGLCEYALINGQWDLHGTEVVHFSALLYLLERYLRSGGLVFPLLIGLLLGAGHSFNLFTSALFSAAYIAARSVIVSDSRAVAAWVKTLGWLGAGVMAGVLVMAPMQLPSLIAFLDSPRVTGGHAHFERLFASLFSINDWPTIFASVAGVFGKGILGIGDAYSGWGNYLEGPGFYVGMPFLLFASQLFQKGASRAEKRVAVLALGGIVLYILFPAFRYVVFGFNHVAFRVSTLWISMLIIVVGVAGIRRQLANGLSVPLLLATALFLVSVIAIWESTSGSMSGAHVRWVVAWIFAYVLVAAMAHRHSSLMLVAICSIWVAELIVQGRPALVDREAVDAHGLGGRGHYEDGTREAVDWIRSQHAKTDFYRIEKDYLSVFLLDSLVQGYRGIRSYFFHGAGVTRFVDSMAWPRTVPHSNYIEADLSRAAVLDALAVKYILSRSRYRDTDPSCRFLATVSGIHIYERPFARSLAVVSSSYIEEAAANALSIVERDGVLRDSVIVDPADVTAELASIRSNAAVQSIPVAIHGDSEITGRYEVDGPRLLAFAFPYAPGWKLFIDGSNTPVPLIRINYGLTGALVPAGNHDFTLRYSTPGRALGWLVSPVTLLLIALVSFLRRRCAVEGRHDLKIATSVATALYPQRTQEL